MRPAKYHEAHALGHLFPQEITCKRTRLANFLGCYLRVIGSVNNNAEECIGMFCPQRYDALLEAVQEGLQICGWISIDGRNERMTETLARQLIGNVDQRVLVSMAIRACTSILSIAEAIIHNTG